MTDSAKRSVRQLATIVILLACAQVSAQDFAALPTSASKHGDTQEKIELGKQLYFDPRLSATGTVSCKSIGCTECHSGPALNGWQSGSEAEFVEFPRNVDSHYVKKYDLVADLGRSKASGDDRDDHHFKTPTLRNITLTAPYFHHGRVSSLAEACRLMAETQLDVELSDTEVADLTAFMEALEGEFPNLTFPRLPSRSGESVLDASVNAGPSDQS